MSNKRLRIVIVDAEQTRLIQIEKSLNRLGYFRILPVQHLDDLRALDHDLVEPFDVIIANKALIASSEINFNLFKRTTRKIDYALLYDEQKAALEDDTIIGLMARIDPASPWECLKNLTWIKYKNDASIASRSRFQQAPGG